ncbi:uncharacterized protein LOC130692459 [Daphnia carinata]|uniref:uncharacterized protein LOC130692459 n=1 Tax=Daphnia carinata TaxID=120202 RepID=UPI00257D99ED|nr:uncharacterized protein LOC130692459 [Daphnia carinata]
MEMDMIIPLNLNLRRKRENFEENEGSSPSKPILKPEQPQKTLPAFIERDKISKNLNPDNYMQKPSNHHGNLKYTYIVERDDGEEISFPSHIIRYTKTEPQISYCENPHFVKGVYQSRKEIFDAADEDSKRTMHVIMNSNSASCQNREFLGRYRKWYASKELFVGKVTEDSENPPVSFATQWETDSEEESDFRDHGDYNMDFLPKPPAHLLNTKLISKVKINKVELPFFEDDDFLTSLVSSQTNVKKEVALDPLKLETKDFQKEYSDFMPSLENSCEKRTVFGYETKDMSDESSAFFSRNHDKKETIHEGKEIQVKQSSSPNPSLEDHKDTLQVGHAVKLEPSQSPMQFDRHLENKSSWIENNDNGDRKRCAPSPDWDEEWRSSRYQSSRDEGRGTSPSQRRDPRTSNIHANMEDWGKNKECSDMAAMETTDLMTLDAKRISLDERLELELGIKVDSEVPITTIMPSPESAVEHFSWTFDSYGMSTSPVKRARGFGPKAAPLGPWILHCRNRALPAAPYIPPHLQSVLYQPLVRIIPPKKENTTPEEVRTENNEEKNPGTQTEDLAKPDGEVKKDWDKELKNLEAVASNLEVADETVLEALEEKLLLFETSNILQSGGDSPSLEAKEEKNKVVKRGKRPKPPPVELKEPGKGILVMPRISLLDEESGNQKKTVIFADSVRPGYGTSSEDEDEHIRSPPPPVVQVTPLAETLPKKKMKKAKKEKIVENDFDPVFDLLPPPPPPPGSPPPKVTTPVLSQSPLPQILSDATIVADAPVASSPQLIESGAC